MWTPCCWRGAAPARAARDEGAGVHLLGLEGFHVEPPRVVEEDVQAEVDVLLEAVGADPLQDGLLVALPGPGGLHAHDLHALLEAPEVGIELPEEEVPAPLAPVPAHALVDARAPED